MLPDWERVRELDALKVAQDYQLIHPGLPKRKTHRAWVGDSGSSVRFYSDGHFYDYETRKAGRAIELLMQRCNLSAFDAACDLASRYGLWAVDEKTAKLARNLASDRPKVFDDDEGRTKKEQAEWFRRRVKQMNHDEQVKRFVEAADLRLDTISVCCIRDTSAGMCIGAPWLGGRVLDHGWGEDNVRAHWSDHRSGRLWAIDLDARHKSDPDSWIPTLLADKLARRMPGCFALVLSSISEDASRCKAHLWMKASDRADSPTTWQQVYDLLRRRFEELYAELAADFDNTPLTPPIDNGPREINRVLRLPGQHKQEGGTVAWLAWTRPNKTICVRDMLEQQHRQCEWRTRKTENSATFGPDGQVRMEVLELDKDGSPAGGYEQIIGFDVWPVSRYLDPDDGTHGLIARHDDDRGRHYIQLGGGALLNSRAHSKLVEQLGDAGVRTSSAGAPNLVMALAQFRTHPELELATVRHHPGWVGSAYVEDEGLVRQADELWMCVGAGFDRRGNRAGTLESWRENLLPLCTTPALRAALLVSLAGPMLRLVDQHSFIVHLTGDSSKGKSTAAYTAASVWGPIKRHDDHGLYSTWRTTINALEHLAEAASDACLSLDEIGHFEYGPEDMGKAIHTIGGDQGKERMKADGSQQRLRRWRCTVLSTGELPIATLLGEFVQGGHLVRVLDVGISEGDCSTSAHHADEVRRLADMHFGHPGRVMVEQLQRMNQRQVEQLHTRWYEGLERLDACAALGTESSRVLRQIALLGAAGDVASLAGVLDWDHRTIEDVCVWLVERIIVHRQERRLDSPQMRMLKLFLTAINTDERRAPELRGKTLSASPSNLLAIREYHDPQAPMGGQGPQYRVRTSEEMLEKSGLCRQANVEAVHWLRWCREQGLVIIASEQRQIAGYRTRWWVLDGDKILDLIYGEQDETGGLYAV